MLPHEIEPFADAHMDALKSIIESMGFYISNPDEFNSQVMREWYSDLHIAVGGFDHLKTTMVYEIEKRKRYRQVLTDLQSPFQSEKTEF